MTMARSEFHAALARLDSMAKGGSTQLFHTGSDSTPSSHAGVNTSDYQDDNSDGIDDNGTDYSGVKKSLARKVEKSQALTPAEVMIVKGQNPRKLIAAKIAKGQKLTPAESWAIKGGAKFLKGMDGDDGDMDKDDDDDAQKSRRPTMRKATDKPSEAGTPGEADDANSVPVTNALDKEDEIEPDATKSLARGIASGQNLRKGLEMSPILAEFAHAMSLGLEGVQTNVARQLVKSLQPVVERIAQIDARLNQHLADQGEFNKSFAETIIGIGQHVAGNADVTNQQASLPVGAPKSHLRAIQGGGQVQAVQKSFGPGGLEMSGESLAKSQVVSAMTDMVQKGQLNSLEVVKYEMTGEINPQVQQMIMSHINGAGL